MRAGLTFIFFVSMFILNILVYSTFGEYDGLFDISLLTKAGLSVLIPLFFSSTIAYLSDKYLKRRKI